MCCGSNRAAARAAVMAQAVKPAGAGFASAISVIMFEYLGDEPVSIRGAVSGQLYRFARQGDRREVDARDRPSLVGMPVLRWVR